MFMISVNHFSSFHYPFECCEIPNNNNFVPIFPTQWVNESTKKRNPSRWEVMEFFPFMIYSFLVGSTQYLAIVDLAKTIL